VSRLALLSLVFGLLAVAQAAAQFPFFARQQPPEPTIRWIDATADALAVARRTGRPILAYVTAADCVYCRKMEQETWRDADLARLVSGAFVPLRLHAEEHAEEVAALRVRAFPTTVLITPEGRAFAGRAGFVEPRPLSDELLRPALEGRVVAARPAPAPQ